MVRSCCTPRLVPCASGTGSSVFERAWSFRRSKGSTGVVRRRSRAGGRGRRVRGATGGQELCGFHQIASGQQGFGLCDTRLDFKQSSPRGLRFSRIRKLSLLVATQRRFIARAHATSVLPKSLPLKSMGSPVSFESAYAKQSPKFNPAGCRPLPKSA